MIAVAAGALLVLAAAGDIFHSLFHPSGRRTLSGLVIRAVWTAVRRAAGRSPRVLSLAGPLGVLAAILNWTVLLVVGWALVYWPRMPEGYLLGPGLEPAGNGDFTDALYLSMVILSTLGFGDIAPLDTALRLLAPAEALMGFGLLTASLTWVLSMYPVLRRMRAFAEEVITLDEAAGGGAVAALAAADAPERARILSGFLHRLVAVRTDLVQSEHTYFFHTGGRLHSLADALPVLDAVARWADAEGQAPEVRLAGRRLGLGLSMIAETLSRDLLRRPGLGRAEAFAVYAEDHLAGRPHDRPAT